MRWRILLLAVWVAAGLGMVALGGAAQGADPRTAPSGLPDGTVVLRSMLGASRLIDHEGTKVVTAVRGARAQTLTILESYKRLGKLRLEFLSPETVSGRLIIDDGATAWQYEPALHLVIRGPSFATPVTASDRFPDVMLRYTPRVLGSEEVIGRQTVVLDLIPNAGGVARRYWVDRFTGVVLRTEERNPRGELVYVSYFTRISYGLNLPSALFRFNFPAGARLFSFYLSGDPVPTPQALQQEANFPIVVPPTLPLAYHFQHGTVARYGALRAAAATYSDGVRVLSVFQTPSSQMAFPQVGTTVPLHDTTGRFLDLGYFKILLWQSRGSNFAVVGSLPVSGLMTAADALNALKP